MWQTKRLYFGCCKTKFVSSLWEICFFELVKDINQTVLGNRQRQTEASLIHTFQHFSIIETCWRDTLLSHTHTHNQPLLSVCASVMNLSDFIDLNTQTLYSAYNFTQWGRWSWDTEGHVRSFTHVQQAQPPHTLPRWTQRYHTLTKSGWRALGCTLM